VLIGVACSRIVRQPTPELGNALTALLHMSSCCPDSVPCATVSDCCAWSVQLADDTLQAGVVCIGFRWSPAGPANVCGILNHILALLWIGLTSCAAATKQSQQPRPGATYAAPAPTAPAAIRREQATLFTSVTLPWLVPTPDSQPCAL
jgi:hypothetical protein